MVAGRGSLFGSFETRPGSGIYWAQPRRDSTFRRLKLEYSNRGLSVIHIDPGVPSGTRNPKERLRKMKKVLEQD
jgi:hypothetical protein